MITGFIRGQRLTLVSPTLAAGTWRSVEARFVFETADWDGYRKFAHFRPGDGGEERISALGEDGAAEATPDLYAGDWTVWIHGDAAEDGEVTARMTTETASLTVKETGAGDPLPLPPTYGEQVLALVIALKEQAAEAVREGSAESLRRVGALLSDCEAAVEDSLGESREAVDSRLAENEAAMNRRLAENEAAVLAAAGVLRNRKDGSLIPVWAGSEAEFDASDQESGTICLVDVL